MNVAARAQRDLQRVTTDPKGAGTAIIFVKPDNSLTKTVYGATTKHMLKTDENGFKSIGKTATIAVSEAALIAVSYPTRNENEEIDLLQHRVTWTDVSGITWTYTIRQTRPDEKVGFITCILDDYEQPITPNRIIIGWSGYPVNANVVSVTTGLTQTLGNGDVIPLEYVLNSDGTLTIPYLTSVAGISVLTPLLVNNDEYQDISALYDAGTFNVSTVRGGFAVGNLISFNAYLPIWSV